MVKTNIFKYERKNKKKKSLKKKINQQHAHFDCQRMWIQLPPFMSMLAPMSTSFFTSYTIMQIFQLEHEALLFKIYQRFKDKCAERRLHFVILPEREHVLFWDMNQVPEYFSFLSLFSNQITIKFKG